jgi:hypothetical protein
METTWCVRDLATTCCSLLKFTVAAFLEPVYRNWVIGFEGRDMNVSPTIRGIGIGLTAMIALLSVWPVMNVAGFCWAEKRFLSDEEIITRVIEEVYNNYPPRNYGSSSGALVQNPITYRSLNDFVAQNKDCCSIVSKMESGLALTWYDSIRGAAAALVEVKFRVEDETNMAGASTGMKPGIALGYGAVTNCGRVWNGI